METAFELRKICFRRSGLGKNMALTNLLQMKRTSLQATVMTEHVRAIILSSSHRLMKKVKSWYFFYFLFFSIRRAVANGFSTTWAAEGGVCLNKVIGSVDREVGSSNQNNTICLLLLSGFRAFRSHLVKTCWKSRWETCKWNIKRGRFFPLRLNPVHPSSAFEDLVDKKWENHQRISNILEVSLTSLFLISLRLRMTWAPCGLPLINTRKQVLLYWCKTNGA